MELAEVVSDAAVVRRDAHIPIPDAGVLEVAGAPGKGGAAGALIDFDGQADGRDAQRAQVSGAVIEAAGHIRPSDRACPCPAGVRAYSGIGDASRLGNQPAAVQGAGEQIGGQGLAGAGEIAGGGAEGGRDQGGVLAPVHVGVLLLIDRAVTGRPAEQVVLRGLN